MAQEIINVGASPNDGLGDPIRTSFIKCNNNFGELYSRVQSTPPVTLVGSIGDTAGMTAYDSLYFYYCFQDYDGSSVIWNQVPHSGNAQISTLTVSGDISAGGNVDVVGNITGAYLFGNGAGLTGVVAAAPTAISNGTSTFTTYFNGNATIGASGTSNVVIIQSSGITVTGNTTTTGNTVSTGNVNGGNINAVTLVSSPTITATGNVNGGNVVATANVTGGNLIATGFLYGDGGFLSNVTVTSNAVVSTIQNGTSSIAIGSAGANAVVSISGIGNVARFTTAGFSTSGDFYAGGSTVVVGNITGGNLSGGAGIITTTGNINGGNLNITDGITAGTTVTATGNITGGNLKTSSILINSTAITGATTITATGNITGGNLKTGSIVIASTAITGATTVTATGNVTGGNLKTGSIVIASTTITGATTVTATGNITGGNLLAGTGVITTTGNITGGNLSITNDVTAGTTVTATGNVTGGNLISSGLMSVNGSITGGGVLTINASDSATAIINGGTTGVGNIGSTSKTFNTVFAKATTAQYADLAEKYLADQDYPVGTVVMVGGEREVTACSPGSRAIGTVSANPAYMMNSELEGGTYIALKGRVPVMVAGAVLKGQSLIAGNNGTAVITDPNTPGVFAIALETSSDAGVKLVEAIIL